MTNNRTSSSVAIRRWPPASAEPAAVPRTVDRYEIREEIGRGGTATVYLACQTDLRRMVALKELSAFSAADPGFARRFVRESRVTASLSHPSLVTIHDYFEAEGSPYIAMEYLPNGSLRTRVGALSLARIAGVLESMLRGLAHAHAHGVVHRDLKPENVLVTADGGVKIADFGIAKALDSVETALTVTGTTIGTPAYMAPEQALAGEIGPWTDLYSIGIVAFELVAGHTPFGDAEPVAILLRHVKDAPPLLTDVAPSIEPGLAHWVAGLLEKAPEDRPASASEAWEALEEIVLAALGPRWRRGAPLPAEALALTAGGSTPATAPLRTPTTGPLRTPTTGPLRTPTTGPLPTVDGIAAGEDPRLAATIAPRLPPPAPPPAAAARPAVAAAGVRRVPAWRIAAGLIVLGWLLAALLMSALSGSGGSQPPPQRTVAPGAPAATQTPPRQSDAGVGDSRSDDPSDDEPDGPEP
jgi:hypothetical protein